MMHMTFYWGQNVTLLIDSWKTDSWFSYFVTLVICFLFPVLYQLFEVHRLQLKLLSSSANGIVGAIENEPLLYTKFFSSRKRKRFIGTVLFGMSSVINYFMMLAVMSFNGGVFVAIVVGLAVGYWLFRNADDEQIMLIDDPCACG